MAEIYIIGDEADNYGEIETNAPLSILKDAISLHLEDVLLGNMLKVVIYLNELGYKAAQRQVLYLHLPGEIQNYYKRLDKLNAGVMNEKTKPAKSD